MFVSSVIVCEPVCVCVWCKCVSPCVFVSGVSV